MAARPDFADCTLTGRHRVVRSMPDADNPSIRRARCSRCGHQVVRSLITRRWLISGMMG